MEEGIDYGVSVWIGGVNDRVFGRSTCGSGSGHGFHAAHDVGEFTLDSCQKASSPEHQYCSKSSNFSYVCSLYPGRDTSIPRPTQFKFFHLASTLV